jgi:adenine-specific DNA-methyltransferase
MNSIQLFKDKNDFPSALKAFFEELNVPFNVISEYQTEAKNIIGEKKCNEIIDAIYPFAIVTKKIFNKVENEIVFDDVKKDKYEGILLFGVEINKENPSRTELAEITRQLNKEFKGTPVVAVFRYHNKLTFANAERLDFKQTWREGEKVGKISMLKDIEIEKTHRAHELILEELGKHKAKDFESLYKFWQDKLLTKELNNKFYIELYKWYLWAKDNASFPNEHNEEVDKYLSESLIRFISRMLFVWFMKEKKLISNQIFDQNELKNILNDFNENAEKNQYYKAILQNLFFATLNVPIKNRKWIDGKKGNQAQKGDPLIYRYEKEFNDSEKVIEQIFMQIPFLNGGLFDCLDDRTNNVFIDGFTKIEKHQPKMPNFLFFGEFDNIDLSHHFAGFTESEKKKWKNIKVQGLLTLFSEYKFTIEENTPYEVDVALDPELLGKVFENLLATFNEETKDSARKQTGSFYTPREIVNYMVDESLKQHLKTHLSNNEQDIENLFKNNIENLNEPLKKEMVHKLFDCKILDPACGSGAFPMGILHKMVELLNTLDPKNDYLKEVEGKKLDNLIKDANKLSDSHARSETVNALQKQKETLLNAEYDYVRKLYLIENCIYGVDIQPIAIQISKLRFFISLLVEQHKDKTKENVGIEPLPNMDFKLLAANSLIAAPQEDKAQGFFAEQDDFFETFEALTHDYFTLNTPESKKAKKQEIIALINKKVDEKKRLVASYKGAKILEDSIALWESYPNIFKEKAVGFFEIPYFFPKVKEGFDIVIGNPPYVQKPKGIFSKELFPYSEGKDKGKQNLYKVFVENSYNLLKPNGVATMIVQSSLMCDLSSQYTRELLLTKTKINHIIEFPKKAKTKEGQVFDNVLQGTCIYNFSKKTPNDETTFNVSIDNDVTTLDKIEFEKLNQFELLKIYPNGFFIPLIKTNEYVLINKIFKNSNLLKQYFSGSKKGDLTSDNDKSYFHNIENGFSLIRGNNVQRFYLKEPFDKVLIDVKTKIIAEKNSNFNIIVFQNITGTTDKYRIHCCLVNEKKNNVFLDTTIKIYIKDSNNDKMILSQLNSKLIDWYFRKTSTNNHVNGYEIEQLPIKLPINQDKFNSLVNQILEDKKSGRETSLLEHQIDIMVYHLYELTYEEACVIDPALSIEDFEKYKLEEC